MSYNFWTKLHLVQFLNQTEPFSYIIKMIATMNEDPSHVAIWHQKCMSDRTSLSKTITKMKIRTVTNPVKFTRQYGAGKINKFGYKQHPKNCFINSLPEHIPSRIWSLVRYSHPHFGVQTYRRDGTIQATKNNRHKQCSQLTKENT